MYSSASSFITVMTDPLAGRESSQEISRALISPLGLTFPGETPVVELPPQALSVKAVAAAAAARVNFFISGALLRAVVRFRPGAG